ncbi:MAG TPA: DUF5916 domain-containing protein [Vicinamibacterales bacterium]|jgi:hypothetical protein
MYGSWIRLVLLAVLAAAVPASAQTPAPAPPAAAGFRLTRAASPIKIDGDLSDEAWRTAARVERWYEVQPGDNNEPPVKSVGYLTYDDRALYVAFEFDDPAPAAIRAPYGDHDSISGNNTDFGGIIIDTQSTKRTAIEFFVSPRNVQYDAVTDDATGENQSPDFFWDSAAKITDRGWTLEMRIPFSTLRYPRVDPQKWGIILMRNYPRNFRYQFASAVMPRGSNCFICHVTDLEGLEHLPAGGHLVAAPYASASDTAHPEGGVEGAPLKNDPVDGRIGVDVKYSPDANHALDLTVRPDFSQIESDTAQISANERFALFYPEKRPFFLEGVDLFQTPIQAVYTRTITDPTWGTRLTGKDGNLRYTALVARDGGGGLVILPGSNGSSSAPQDFTSMNAIGRVKEQIGRSFVGALVTDREITSSGGGYNRLVGPDFEWRPNAADVVTGQVLYSTTQTPNQPDLDESWDGRRESGTALQTYYTRNTRHFDMFGGYSDITDGFRADLGFVPQVGYRQGNVSTGWTVHPKGAISRERTFFSAQYQADRDGRIITENAQPGFGMDTKWNGFVQVRYTSDRTRAGDELIGRQQGGFTVQFSPTRRLALLFVDTTFGQDIDFDNARPATGYTLNLRGTVVATDHLSLDLIQNTRSLDANAAAVTGHLLTEQVSHVKATYTFTSRMFVRAIGQYVETTRDPSLYTFDVPAKSGSFSGSLLFAYKLNWQSVMFVGYGDDRDLPSPPDPVHGLQPVDRQFFVKLSYALQR